MVLFIYLSNLRTVHEAYLSTKIHLITKFNSEWEGNRYTLPNVFKNLQDRFLAVLWYFECLLIMRIVIMAERIDAPATAPNTMPTTAPVLKLDAEGVGIATTDKTSNNL